MKKIVLALACLSGCVTASPVVRMRASEEGRLRSCLLGARYYLQQVDCYMEARNRCQQLGLELTCAEDTLWTNPPKTGRF